MLTSLGHGEKRKHFACAFHKIIQLLRSRAGANDGKLLDFFADDSALQRKNHIGCPFKIADVPFPAHPAPAMLQTRKLLLHFPTAFGQALLLAPIRILLRRLFRKDILKVDLYLTIDCIEAAC